MEGDLNCSPRFEDEVRQIRDLLYRAVQAGMAENTQQAHQATKEAYESLSGLLDALQSNLKQPSQTLF